MTRPTTVAHATIDNIIKKRGNGLTGNDGPYIIMVNLCSIRVDVVSTHHCTSFET